MVPTALRRVVAPLALATIATWTSPSARAQPERVALEPGLTEGARYTHDLSLDLLVSQDTRVTHIVQGARLNLLVQNVNEEGAAIRATFDRLTNVYSERIGEGGVERQYEFVWRRAEDPMIERAASASEGFTTLNRTLAGSTIQIFATPAGEIRRIEGLATLMQLVDDGDEQEILPPMLGVFSPGQLAPVLQPIFHADGLVEAPRGEGDGWQSTQTTPAGAAGAIEFIHDWSVAEVEGDEIEYRGRESVQMLRPDDAPASSPSVRIDEHAGQIDGAWSRQAGVLEGRSVQRRTALVWTLGEQSLRQTQRVEITLNRVPRPVVEPE